MKGSYDESTRTVMFAEEQLARVIGEMVYVTNHHPVGKLYYYDEAFFCGLGRYPIDAFYKLLRRVKTENLKDSRTITECLHPNWKTSVNGTFTPASKEKEVTQYQALLPVDLERHLYSGSTLYDLEKHEFRKISTVTKASTKAGHTTTVTFVGGAKRILKNTMALDVFAKGHNWVSLREMPNDDPCLRYDIPTRSWVQSQLVAAKGPDTVHHYSRYRRSSGDTGITHIGWESINALIDEKIKQTPPIIACDPVDKPTRKRRWFR